MNGTVESRAAVLDCERVVAAVPGAVAIENHLKTIEDAGDPARMFQAQFLNRI